MAKAGSLDRHIKIAAGRSSPKTTYSIAPLAKLSAKDRKTGPIIPNQNPNKAPSIVGAPESAGN